MEVSDSRAEGGDIQPYFIRLPDATEGLINMHGHRLLLPSVSPCVSVSEAQLTASTDTDSLSLS